MNLALEPVYCQNPVSNLSFQEAMQLRDGLSWSRLNSISVGEAIEVWLKTCRYLTSETYRTKMRRMIDCGYIRPEMNLQGFALVNQEAIVDDIKHDPRMGAECNRQTIAAAYISFTAFLHRRFGKVIPRALPCTEGKDRTFFKVRDKVLTNAMDQNQLKEFLAELSKNHRPIFHLIARVILQGAKRISEVLTLKVEGINWETCQISFIQAKTEGKLSKTIITYPQSIMNELRQIVPPSGFVFGTKSGNKFDTHNVGDEFVRAGQNAEIPFKVTPHVLRATAITAYKRYGCSDSDIMKISGHTSAQMVNAYDKTDVADNPSKRINLVL